MARCDLVSVNDRSQVKEGAGHRGHGDAVDFGDLVGREGGLVGADALPAPNPPGCGHISPGRVAAPDPRSAAAERWLSTAPGPQANTAAIHAPDLVKRRRPTA